jgi:transposase
MNDTDLYRQILGIELPWYVSRVELDLASESVRVYLEYRLMTEWTCPSCGTGASVHGHRDARSWRHLDSCQLKTFLVASLPRVKCPKHGVLTVRVPWTEPESRFTQLFERFAIDVLRATGVQAKAAELLRLSPGQVHDLMCRAVVRGRQRRDAEESVPHASLDEKSFKSGHQFITVLGDSWGKRVLEVAEGRTLEVAENLLKQGLSESQKRGVQSVSMDMWVAFMNARERVLPEADTVHDRFHVAKYLNDAVDKTRRAENRALRKEDDASLHQTKYLWLKALDNMTEKQRAALEALSGLELETAKVWAFKESFRSFFECQSETDARTFFVTWYDAALALGNAHLTQVARMLMSHINGLLAYIRHRVTNALAEALNGHIQRIKANARGFRRFENFRIAILFFLGKLELCPHKSP